MKQMILLAGFAALALGQQGSHNYNFTAMQQTKDAFQFHLTGDVVFDIDGVVIRADAAEFDQIAREIKPTGNVVIKFK